MTDPKIEKHLDEVARKEHLEKMRRIFCEFYCDFRMPETFCRKCLMFEDVGKKKETPAKSLLKYAGTWKREKDR